jgi:hypothetical protein
MLQWTSSPVIVVEVSVSHLVPSLQFQRDDAEILVSVADFGRMGIFGERDL